MIRFDERIGQCRIGTSSIVSGAPNARTTAAFIMDGICGSFCRWCSVGRETCHVDVWCGRVRPCFAHHQHSGRARSRPVLRESVLGSSKLEMPGATQHRAASCGGCASKVEDTLAPVPHEGKRSDIKTFHRRQPAVAKKIKTEAVFGLIRSPSCKCCGALKGDWLVRVEVPAELRQVVHGPARVSGQCDLHGLSAEAPDPAARARVSNWPRNVD